MLTDVHPKLPMRDKATTRTFYVERLGFEVFGQADYAGYLMVHQDAIQIHFFEYRDLDPKENYGQVYIRTQNIDQWHALVKKRDAPCTHLEVKPWGQKEFSILDPDNNLLTFGQTL